MNSNLKALYHPVILSHNKEPFHYEKKPDFSHILDAYNPLCGDRFKLYLNIENEVIEEAYFHGYGCAVSKASTSVLVANLRRKTLAEAHEIIQSFLAIAHQKQDKTAVKNETFTAFAAAKDFAGRLKCATLAWDEMEIFLEKKS